MTLRQLWFLLLVVLGCGSPIAPGNGPVRPGLYVLATIDHQPAPLFTDRADYGDTLSVMAIIEFDSIRVVDDTSVQRHYALAQYRQRVGETPQTTRGQEINGPGVILSRDGTFLLLLRLFGLPVPTPESYVLRPEGLLRRFFRVRAQCTPLQVCTIVSSGYVDALYTRR